MNLWPLSHRIGQRSRKQPGGSRSAFTLLEVLVSLGLSVILISAIYGAISLYIRISYADQAMMERSRVARGLLRQMTLDLQSVLFYVPDESFDDSTIQTDTDVSSSDGTTPTAGAGTGSSADSSSGTSGGITINSLSSNTTGQESASVGLIGDTRKLTIHINRPARGMAYSPLFSGAGLAARTSDLQSVTYFLADSSASGMEGEVGKIAERDLPTSSLRSGPQGLARLAGDKMAIEHAEEDSDLDALAEAARVIAPEVVALEFRYFDGLNWVAEWDSVTSQRLPNAVEITLGLKNMHSEEERRAHQHNTAAKAGWDQPVEFRRHVVALPLSEPYSGGL